MFGNDEKPFIAILSGLHKNNEPVMWAYYVNGTDRLLKQMISSGYIRKIDCRSPFFVGDWGDGNDVVYDDIMLELTLKGHWIYWIMKNNEHQFKSIT